MDIKTIDEYILMEMTEESPEVSMLAMECETTEEYVVKKLIKTEERVYALEDRVAELINKYEVGAAATAYDMDEMDGDMDDALDEDMEEGEDGCDPGDVEAAQEAGEGIGLGQTCNPQDFVSKKATVYNGHEEDMKKQPYEPGKLKIVLDLSDLDKTVEQMLTDAKDRAERDDSVKDFVKKLETEYVPALKEMLDNAGVPKDALEKELAAATIVYVTFIELARLGDSKINRIIAENLGGFKK